jgi:hypothetical protein
VVLHVDTHFLSVYDSMGMIPGGVLAWLGVWDVTVVDHLVAGTCGAHAFRSHCTYRREGDRARRRRMCVAFLTNCISHHFPLSGWREVASQCTRCVDHARKVVTMHEI